MYYVNYDEDTGTIVGIYPSSYNPDDVPEPKITITDAQYNALGDGYYVVMDGALVQEAEEQGFIPINGTSEAIKDLQTEYSETLEKLKDASVAATIMDADKTEIQSDYKALLSDFTRKAIDIEEGGSITTGEYCPMCGTLTENGVCPNCHWRL